MAKCYVNPKSGWRYFPSYRADGTESVRDDGKVSVTGERNGRWFGPIKTIDPAKHRIEDHPKPTLDTVSGQIGLGVKASFTNGCHARHRNHERRFLMPTRIFHLSDILSITTKRLVSTRHIDGVYDILNFMTGDNLFTHQLPRASREMAPVLLWQHPQLRHVDASSVTSDTWKDWMDVQIAAFGETLPVTAEPQSHQVLDPIAEAEQMVGRDRVVVARPAGEQADDR